jgi:hypothetical protein
MQKAVFMFLTLALATPVIADGPLPNLTDPPVRPIIRDTGQGAAGGGAPLVIPTGQSGRFGFCNNGQRSGTPPDAYGYDVKIACDAVLIGGGILGVMFMLGAAAATE